MFPCNTSFSWIADQENVLPEQDCFKDSTLKLSISKGPQIKKVPEHSHGKLEEAH